MTALRAAEVEQKKRYDSAIDIEDMSEATAVTIDARTKIQQLRKWIEDLQRISNEIEISYPISSSSAHNPQDTMIDVVPQSITDLEKQNGDGISSTSQNIGEYVRQKMYALSKSGYVFTDDQLLDMQDYGWSRNVLNLPHPFVRIYNDFKDLLEQTSINGVPRRYWIKDRFRFGKVTLLVYSGWAPLYKPFFDAWYDSLMENLSAEDVPLQEKAEHEEPKIGVYVRVKLRNLCDLGYIPTLADIDSFQQKRWSKETLNLNYPFARVYNAAIPLHAQLSTDNGANRFWAEIFDFGKCKLLFCSQWYERDRAYFDRWYDGLVISQYNDVWKDEQEAEQCSLDLTNIPISENDDIVEILPITPQVESEPEKTTVDVSLSIEGFTLLGKQYNTSSWQELLIRLCETMVLKKPYKIASLGANADLPQLGRPIISLGGQQIESYQKLSNGLFVDAGGSDNEIKMRCEHILSACGYSRDVLQIL